MTHRMTETQSDRQPKSSIAPLFQSGAIITQHAKSLPVDLSAPNNIFKNILVLNP